MQTVFKKCLTQGLMGLTVATTLLSACATATPSKIVVKEPVCATIETWSAEDQDRAADEILDLLPIDSPVTWAIGAFIRMRDEARACRKVEDDKNE